MKPIKDVQKYLNEKFPNDKATIEWLKTQKKSTLFCYASYWKYFLKFAGKNGSEILKERKTHLLSSDLSERRQYEKRLLEFKQWLNGKMSTNGIRTALAVVKSFFSFHFVDLRFRTEEKRKINEKARKNEDYWLTLEDIEKMASVGNIKQKYILVVGKSLGLRASDFLNLKIGLFTSVDLDSEPPIFLGKINTIKENVKAFPFLDVDSVKIVKDYLRYLKAKRGKLDNKEPMLKCTPNNLNLTLRSLAEKCGLKLGNKQLRFHCLRKFLYDSLTTVTAESHAKQIIGKSIPEQAYISPRNLRLIYKKVQPLTCFSKNSQRNHRIEELENAIIQLTKEKQALQTRLKTLEKLLSQNTDTIKRIINSLATHGISIRQLKPKQDKPQT